MEAPRFSDNHWRQAINWTRDLRANMLKHLPDLITSDPAKNGGQNKMVFFDRSVGYWYKITVAPITVEEAKMFGVQLPHQQPHD